MSLILILGQTETLSPVPPPTSESFLLLESGDFLLLESGDKLKLESSD